MQRAVVAHEGGEYPPASYLRPESVAGAVLFAASAPDDAALTELVLRPTGVLNAPALSASMAGSRTRRRVRATSDVRRVLPQPSCSIRSRWISTSSAPRWTTTPPASRWWIDAGHRPRSAPHLADVGGPGTDELAGAGWRGSGAPSRYESYRDMAEFVAAVHHRRAADLLDRAIAGRGAFRRFKDTLFEFPELRDQWFRFRDARSRRRAVRWLADEGLVDRADADRVAGRATPTRSSDRRGRARPRSPSTWACSTATGCGRCCCSAPGRDGEGRGEFDLQLLVVLTDLRSPWEELRRMDDVLWRHTERSGLAITALPVSPERAGRRRARRRCGRAVAEAAWVVWHEYRDRPGPRGAVRGPPAGHHRVRRPVAWRCPSGPRWPPPRPPCCCSTGRRPAAGRGGVGVRGARGARARPRPARPDGGCARCSTAPSRPNADGAVPQPEAAAAIADATEVVDVVATWIDKSTIAGESADEPARAARARRPRPRRPR